MRQRTKAFKVRSAALLLTGLLAFGCLLPIPVYAGLETGETYSNSFDFGALDGAWVSECAQVETDEGQEPGLRFAGASEGAGIVTKEEISAGKIRMEVDVDRLDFSSGGWLGFLIGTQDTDPIMDWNHLADGKHVMLSYVNGIWHLVTQTRNEDGSYVGYDLVDGDLNPIQSGSDSESRHYFELRKLPSNQGVLAGVTLIVTLDDAGSFTFSMKQDGAETLLAQTKDKQLDPYTAGRMGVCVMQGERAVTGKLTNVRVFADDASQAAAEFHFDQSDVGSDYLIDYSGNTRSVTFGALGKMKLTATGEKAAYAVNKTSAQIDRNVVGYDLAKNITVRQDLYLTDFGTDAVFLFCFGMGNAYDTELGAKDTYAVRIENASGQNTFSVVKFTEDGGAKWSTLMEPTAFGEAGGKIPLALSVDGDGSLTVTVGDRTESAESPLEFSRNKMYFGLWLTGSATVKIDEFSIRNAVYSKPENKDLTADFTNNEINVNEWYLPSWGGNLEERYDGVYAADGELVFRNVNTNAGITTKAQFSNFDLSFDITDIQREEKNGIGPSTDIRIMYGISGYNDAFNILYYQELRPLISFRASTRGTVYSILHVENEIADTLPERYDMFSEAAKGEIFTVRLTMTDGLLALYLKTSDEEEFTRITEIQTAGALTGSIRISGYGDGVQGDGACSNFRIDNLSVKNTDTDPSNHADYGFKSSREWIEWDGYEYTKTWNNGDLLPISGRQQTGENSALIPIVIGAGAAAVILVGAVVFWSVRRRKKSGARK